MGLDIDLVQDGKIVQVKNHQFGSIFTVGGCSDASCLLTYNYFHFYSEILGESLTTFLANKKAKETIPMLQKIVEKLGTDQSGNYWQDTEGNAGYAISVLLTWAKEYPDAVWEVSP